MKRNEIAYFGAGPAALETAVLEEAAQHLLNYAGTGLGIGELSHRGRECGDVVAESKRLLCDLLHIPDTHDVLFLQGGGTVLFSAVVYNLLAYAVAKGRPDPVVDYLVTGAWSLKAADEAARLGARVNIAANAKTLDGQFGRVPHASAWRASADPLYTYYCDNETINGIECAGPPEVKGDLVCDMSSNILSRPIPNLSRYAVIFAGAQKNIGMAGITLVIVRKDILNRADAKGCRDAGVPVCPIMLDFRTILDNNSLYNTLPIFTLDVMRLSMQKLQQRGGVEAQEELARKKSDRIYTALEHPMFKLVAQDGCRSRMNVTFTITPTARETDFLAGAEAKLLTGLKGHRSVGGIRISLYNAVTMEMVDRLALYIEEFTRS